MIYIALTDNVSFEKLLYIMLKSLYVKNFALVEEIELTFGASLNIITGETGAGKSLIVDALMLVLGERASADMIRLGERKAIVEGVFTIQGNQRIVSILKKNDYDIHAENVILRREIHSKGVSRCFINDSPAPVSLLREVGTTLVDFHGQHEHQSILDTSTHCTLLDDVGGLESIVDEYKQLYTTTHQILNEYLTLLQREQELRQRYDFQQFQVQEITDVSPQEGEEQQLERELRIIENAEKLHSSTSQIYSILYGNDQSVRDSLVIVRNIFDRLCQIDSNFDSNLPEIESVIISIEEIAKQVQSYNSTLDFYPERLEVIRQRIQQLQGLKRKYGSINDAIEYRRKAEQDIAMVENFEIDIQKLTDLLAKSQLELGQKAQRLTAKRKETAAKIEKSIVSILDSLGMPSSRFSVKIDNEVCNEELFDLHSITATISNTKYKCYQNGIDTVHFYISTNAGMELRPLEKVVSGGEASRIMLAIKSILAKNDRLPMLVFDEIDTGISGRIAQKVGIAMKDLARYHQIIAITHQPQIAALADTHISVRKREVGGSSIISTQVLSKKERINEVAMLLSGESITDAALKSAKELISIG